MSSSRRRERGSTLVVVLVLCSASLLIVASTMQWTTTNTTLTHRNNEYFRTVAVAEAATEKVIGKLAHDYQENGDALVFANLDNYRQTIPTASENTLFSKYDFSDGQQNANRSYMEFVPPAEFRVLSAQYRGLRGYSTAFRVISNARETASRFNIVGAVRQDVEVATIPLFQFAIFYNLDLEINPGPPMTVTGPVHANANIYLEPQAPLTFQGDVTASGDIINNKKPGDCSNRVRSTVTFQGEHDGGVSTLNLPIGTNNSAAAVRQVIEIPPAGESVTSAMGKQRLYNQADVVILVNNAGTTMTSGRINNFGTSIPSAQYNKFLKTTGVDFYNKRENKTVRTVQIDVNQLRLWNATNNYLRTVLPQQDIRIVYVDDQRSAVAGKESGIRLINGKTLLPKGFTVVSPDPLYVQGHYNAPDGSGAQGTHNTAPTLPAALLGDAVTVLSTAWNDANAGAPLANRTAANTTVNAAFLAGIVQTANCNYSGGVENFPRFLENWSGKNFTYNGSMVVMYDSQTAIGLWQGTGSAIGIYNPPNRDWAFDNNFRDINKIPPGTPSVRALIRGGWAMVRPNSINVVNMFN